MRKPRTKNEALSIEAAEDKFNPNKRNSLKHISVNGIAKLLKSKLEQGGGGGGGTGGVEQQTRPPDRPKSVQQFNFLPASSPSKRMTTSVTNPATGLAATKHLIQSICYLCDKPVSIMERQNVLHLVMHANCFRCHSCKYKLASSSYEHHINPNSHKCNFSFKKKDFFFFNLKFWLYSFEDVFYCTHHKPLSDAFRRIHSLQASTNVLFINNSILT